MDISRRLVKFACAAVFYIIFITLPATPASASTSEAHRLPMVKIRTSGALVLASNANRINVYELVSGDRVLYYEIAQVYEQNGLEWLQRLPFQQIRIMGSNEQFEKLQQMKTCEQIQLSMILYINSSSAAFLTLGERDDNRWMEKNPDYRSCK